MDYDDNEFEGQNHQLAGEGCSKVSLSLHSYALPKFDFDDSLQGHVRFDNLVQNEGFLAITNQEDNQWIEEYSRGNSGIEFSSSAVWSEATSSESVEMLLKSVGQGDKVAGQLDISNEPGNVAITMDSSIGKDAQQITSDAPAASINREGTRLTADEVLTKQVLNDGVMSDNNALEDTSLLAKISGSMEVACKTRSNEPGAIHVDNQNLSVEAPKFETGVSIQVEQVTSVEPDKRPSPDTSDGSRLLSGSLATAEADDQPKSPIFGVSLVHHDNKEKPEVGFPDDNSQDGIPQLESVVASDSKNPSSSVEKEASSNMVKKFVNELDVHSSSEKKGNILDAGGLLDPKESVIEVNKSNKQQTFVDEARPFENDANHIRQDAVSVSALEKSKVVSPTRVSSKTTDEVDGNFQSVSSSKAKQEEKNFTFEVNKSAGLGQGGMVSQSYPTFQVSMLPKVMEGPSTNSTSTQVDAKQSHEVSVSPQVEVKGKSERKPRRKSVGKESARKGSSVKETTPARDSTRVEKPSTGQVIKSYENVERGGVLPLQKLPDLNNSMAIFRQPFTDNQQLQLRAQILVYGSLISGSPPEEPHMIAAFGQSGGRTWEGVWRAYLERLHLQKAQTNSLQSRSGNTSIGGPTNKTTPPTVNPMIPLSSSLWNISIPSENLQASGMSRTARLDHHQPLSPLHSHQNFRAHNPSWLSQGPFAGQWVAAFNTGPRFPSMPITEAVTLTPFKEPAGPVIAASSELPSGDSKSRKRKKGTASVNVKRSVSAPVVIPLPKTDSVTAPVVISEETLSKVEESKRQAEDAAKCAAAAISHCHGVWSQLERQHNSGLSSDDEAKLVSSAISIAAAASVAKVAAAAAKIASNVAEQARSASSKHAENLDAIVKAAELAAEAVSQAGKIVAMSEQLPLRHLIQAGPEGYWKTPDKKNVKAASKEIQTMEVDGISVPSTSREKDKRKPRIRRGQDLSKTIENTRKSDHGSTDTSNVGQTEPKVMAGTLKENSIKEGCLVEVYKDDDKYNGAWFGANVLSLDNGKALVCYTDIQADEGKLKEWVPLEVEGTEAPKVRVAHPVTTMRFEGTRKRRRAAATDFVWSSGDRVDVWIQNRWCEAVVTDTNKMDLTSLTVQFRGQGESSAARSWHVRPTLIWKDGEWIESHTSAQRLSSQGDTPLEKRLKSGSPVVEIKRTDGSSENVDRVDLEKPEDSRALPLSTHERLFSIGSTRDDKRVGSRLQKEGPRVIFGVPKPGRKQKFMDVSKHYVGDGSNKNKMTSDSVKFTRYLIPQAPGSRGWKTGSRSEAKEKQTAEPKPRTVKPRKPPIPSGRTINKTSQDSNENRSGHLGQSSNVEDAPKHADVASLDVSTKSERLNKRKFIPTAGKPAKVDKSLPEPVEPRRSNRKIQPTSRLLEGLQSSMTISKIPAASHSVPRSHSKATSPKGNTNDE